MPFDNPHTPAQRLVLLSALVVSLLMPGCVSKARCLARYGIPSSSTDTLLVISRPFKVDTIINDTMHGFQEIRQDTLRDSLESRISRGNITSLVSVIGKDLTHTLSAYDTVIPRPLSFEGEYKDYIIRETLPVPIDKPIPKIYQFALYYLIITAAVVIVLIIFKLSR